MFWKLDQAWRLRTPHLVPGADAAAWEPLGPVYPDGYVDGSAAAEADCGFVDEYVLALDDDRDHECGGHEALNVMEILMGILESGMRRSWVRLPQVDREHSLTRIRRESGLPPAAAAPRAYSDWLAREDQRLSGRRNQAHGAPAVRTR